MSAYLIIGDGDFSFSLSLTRKLQTDDAGIYVVATSLETRDQVVCRPNAVENITELIKLQSIVLHEVDGTALNTCAELVQLAKKFNEIVFNFPHIGGKSHMRQNRTLLREFFTSAVQFLNEDGRIRVSLCKGQGGTPVDCCKRGYENSWKVVEMAAEAGLVLSQVETFRAEDYPGYVPTGYRGQHKGFVLDGALRHTFMFPEAATQSLYPPVYIHDVSFWWNNEQGEFEEERVKPTVIKVAGDNLQAMECVSIYHHPQDVHRISYLYRIVYCSNSTALSRSRAGELQLNLRDALVKDLGVEVR